MYGTVRIEAAAGTIKTPYDRAPPPMTEHHMTESPMLEHLMNFLTELFTTECLDTSNHILTICVVSCAEVERDAVIGGDDGRF